MRLFSLLILFLIPIHGRAAESKTTNSTAAGNVVLVTLDGVRWQEFFGGPDPDLDSSETGVVFSRFWSQTAPQSVIYGNPATGNQMRIANLTGVSLPGYFSMMSGLTTGCLANDCDRVGYGTFPERLVNLLGLEPEQAATFASWAPIALAVEHSAGATAVRAGPQAGDSPDDLVSPEARLDRLTFSEALAYLMARRPRFLYISLNDSDHWGHEGDYARYLAALRQYDLWLALLAATIDGLGDYGRNTTLIVTTDHGRGTGADWTGHAMIMQARDIWLYARGPHVSPTGSVVGASAHTHLDIRPTIELLMGLCPRSCDDCGSPLPEVTSGLAACSP